GLMPRAVGELFAHVQRLGAEDETGAAQITVKVSYLQVYNEKLYDLLNPATASPDAARGPGPHDEATPLRLRWDAVKERFVVQNLFEIECASAEEAMRLYAQGARHRQVAATSMNAASSRSHAIFSLSFLRQAGAACNHSGQAERRSLASSSSSSLS
ncbi:unnamed protein product, partial [Prorocentrum cordatum]